MELYVLGTDRALLGVIESFEYLRWTRRYSSCGGFELRAVADANNLALLQMGHIFWKSDDEEAAYIEHVELTMDEQEFIFVRGRFTTSMLGRHIVWGTETLRGDVSDCMSQLITKHLLNPSDINRKVNGYSFSSPNFGISINTQTSYRNLLAAVESLCDMSDIGIKTLWNPVERKFTFTLYKGISSQAVFSREYENLTEQMYTQSLLDHANIALVAGEGDGAVRQLVTVGSGSGETRREIFVDAKDLQSENIGADYTAALVQRGESKLAECPAIQTFDASVNPHGNLTYKKDFDIGQTVKVVSKAWGVTLTARITEIEESYDRDGQSLQVTFGRGLLTLAQKLKGGM